MAAQKILIMGESGTGKTTSMRNCNPATTAIVNPVGKALPFRGKFDTLDNETNSNKIVKWMKEQVAAGKTLIVVDDFQYLLAVPYMNRIKESGWDKYNDFGSNYYDVIDVCKDLPDHVVVAYLSHLETLDNGLTTVKLIGKLLRDKITIEGLFTVVLRTGVNEGKYYFYTQNSGKDTVKSPIGMFPAYAIDNDLKYVDDKIRNYYELDGHKSDDEMAQDDAAVAAEITKPAGRRGRGSAPAGQAAAQTAPAAESGRGRRRSHDEVVQENQQKVDNYMEQTTAAVDQVAGDRDSVPFDEAAAAIDNVPQPELETPPRRTRSERKVDTSANVCEADSYFYIEATGNYVMKHQGDPIPEGGKVISKEEFNAGVKKFAQQNNPVEGAMNAPEDQNQTAPATTGRRRRTR